MGNYKTFLQKLKSIPDDIDAWLLKTEFIVRYLDGNTEGPMHKYFWNPLNNAFKDEIELEQKVIKGALKTSSANSITKKKWQKCPTL